MSYWNIVKLKKKLNIWVLLIRIILLYFKVPKKLNVSGYQFTSVFTISSLYVRVLELYYHSWYILSICYWNQIFYLYNKCLQTMDALDSFEDLTELGHHMVDIPIEPRLAKMIINSVILKCLDPILTIACTLAHKEPCT